MMPLIGLGYVYRRYGGGKSPPSSLMSISQMHVELWVRPGLDDKARFRENFLRHRDEKPYRKPTQVVRSSRPRRTGEWSPRNSAKKQP